MQSHELFWKQIHEEKHERLKSPFFAISDQLNWKQFEWRLNKALKRLEKDPKKGGRPPFDPLVMFKIVVLQSYYQLSDDEMEFQLYDRLSFRQFVGLKDGNKIPDAKTIWFFKDLLSQTNAMKKLFEIFGEHLANLGLQARGGQIIDASIQEVRKPRSRREEAYETDAAKAQRDGDADFTKKNGKRYFGYKNHINMDKRHKFIRSYDATPASPHDSQHFEAVFDEENTGSEIYADSAYRGGKCDELVNAKALKDKRQHRAYRNKPLTGHQERANKSRSKVRALVEHAFAPLKNWAKRFQIRSIGLKRAAFSIGLGNLIYNMRRLLFLEKSGHLQEKYV
jgi:IS5 family transposase